MWPLTYEMVRLVKTQNERFEALHAPGASREHWATLARDRDEWRCYWHLLEQIDEQRDDK